MKGLGAVSHRIEKQIWFWFSFSWDSSTITKIQNITNLILINIYAPEHKTSVTLFDL